MMKKHGFTLAEVLITLGIIGVVAAMTIPTLMANTNGAKFRSQFKKSVSTLNQAALMGVAQYELDFAGTDAACQSADDLAEGTTVGTDLKFTLCGLLNGTLSGTTYIDDVASLTVGGDSNAAYRPTMSSGAAPAVAPSTYHGYQLADGSLFAFKVGAQACHINFGTRVQASQLSGTGSLVPCIGFIDVNGVSAPNREVTCSNGTNNVMGDPCTVNNDASHMTDVFPIVIHDTTVEPITSAGRYVLSTAK